LNREKTILEEKLAEEQPFFEGVFHNDSLWSVTVEMPEPGFPLSWEVMLVNSKKTLAPAFWEKDRDYCIVFQAI